MINTPIINLHNYCIETNQHIIVYKGQLIGLGRENTNQKQQTWPHEYNQKNKEEKKWTNNKKWKN